MLEIILKDTPPKTNGWNLNMMLSGFGSSPFCWLLSVFDLDLGEVDF